MTIGTDESELLERHSAFAVMMLRSLLVGIEMNKGIRGWTRESSDVAEKAFVEALADDRTALTRARTASSTREGL